VDICFCHCWNTPGGGLRAEIFAALDAINLSYIHFFQMNRFSEEKINYITKGNDKNREEKEV
jgi:hypothetical protein